MCRPMLILTNPDPWHKVVFQVRLGSEAEEKEMPGLCLDSPVVLLGYHAQYALQMVWNYSVAEIGLLHAYELKEVVYRGLLIELCFGQGEAYAAFLCRGKMGKVGYATNGVAVVELYLARPQNSWAEFIRTGLKTVLL